jgi:hypothetical protein
MTAPLGVTCLTRAPTSASSVRDASRAPDLPGAEITVASYGDGATSVSALRGTGTLFMVSGSETWTTSTRISCRRWWARTV